MLCSDSKYKHVSENAWLCAFFYVMQGISISAWKANVSYCVYTLCICGPAFVHFKFEGLMLIVIYVYTVYIGCTFTCVWLCECPHLCSAWFFWNNVDWVFFQMRLTAVLYWPWLSDTLSFHWSNNHKHIYSYKDFSLLYSMVNLTKLSQPINTTDNFS